MSLAVLAFFCFCLPSCPALLLRSADSPSCSRRHAPLLEPCTLCHVAYFRSGAMQCGRCVRAQDSLPSRNGGVVKSKGLSRSGRDYLHLLRVSYAPPALGFS